MGKELEIDEKGEELIRKAGHAFLDYLRWLEEHEQLEASGKVTAALVGVSTLATMAQDFAIQQVVVREGVESESKA